jgi:hypothetical protein
VKDFTSSGYRHVKGFTKQPTLVAAEGPNERPAQRV